MVFVEIFRHSFPKGLRYCSQCKLMHSNLYVLVRSNQNKRFLDRADIERVLGQFEMPPYPVLMMNPLVRNIFFLHFISKMRLSLSNKPMWMLTPAIVEEHRKIKQFLEQYDAAHELAKKRQEEGPTFGGAAVAAPVTGPVSAAAAGLTPSQKRRAAAWKQKENAKRAFESATDKRNAKSGAAENIAAKGNSDDANEGLLAKSVEHASAYKPALLSTQFAKDGLGNGAIVLPATATKRNPKEFVDRETFQIHVMQHFHVATSYHLIFIFCSLLCVMLSFYLIILTYFEQVLFYVLYYQMGIDTREKLLKYFTMIEEEHLLAEIPDAYQSRLPPPAFLAPHSKAPPRRVSRPGGTVERDRFTVEDVPIVDPRTNQPILDSSAKHKNRQGSDGDVGVVASNETKEALANADVYCLNIVEMVSPSKDIRVFFIPCPILAPKSFYREIGSLLRAGDVMLMEQTSLDNTHRQPAVMFLPMKNAFSSWLKLDHRFYDILSTSEEPPMILPTTTGTTWFSFLKEVFHPYPMRILLNPIASASSKGDTRVGWGWLLDSIDMIKDMQTASGPKPKAELGGAGEEDGGGDDDDSSEKSAGVLAHLPESRVARAPTSWGNVHPVNMRDEGNAGESRVSKGQQYTTLSMAADSTNNNNQQRTVVVPWSVNQIVNLEASLLREGYALTSVTPVRWVERGWFGHNYADAAGL